MTNDKKKDGKKKDAKKDGKKETVEKSEESLDTTADSGLTTLSDLWSESLSEEIPAIPEAPDREVEEPPVQPVPVIHEEPVLAQVIIKRYTCYKYSSEVKNSHLSISAVGSVMQTLI